MPNDIELWLYAIGAKLIKKGWNPPHWLACFVWNRLEPYINRIEAEIKDTDEFLAQYDNCMLKNRGTNEV